MATSTSPWISSTSIFASILRTHELSVKEKIAIRRWYPAVQRFLEIRGTNKLAGRKARFFLNAASDFEIEFMKVEDTYPRGIN